MKTLTLIVYLLLCSPLFAAIDRVDVNEIDSEILETRFDLEYKTEIYQLEPRRPNGESIVWFLDTVFPMLFIFQLLTDDSPEQVTSIAKAIVSLYESSSKHCSQEPGTRKHCYKYLGCRSHLASLGIRRSLSVPYENTLFPTDAIENFSELMPLYARQTNGGSQSEDLLELAEQIGPFHLFVHSAAGSAGFSIAQSSNAPLLSLVQLNQ